MKKIESTIWNLGLGSEKVAEICETIFANLKKRGTPETEEEEDVPPKV